MATVCLLGSGARAVRPAKEYGFDVLLVLSKNQLKLPAIASADWALVLDYTDPSQLIPALKAVHVWRPIDHVYSFTEPGLLPAALAAEALGCSGQPVESVRRTRDKVAMRRCLSEAGLPPVAFATVSTAQELVAFGERHGWPVVIKAVDGTGKQGVQLVEGPRQADLLLRRVQAEIGASLVLAEEFLPGPEVSVEALSVGGKHFIIAVTDEENAPPYFNETGHTIPSSLPAGLQDEICSLTVKALDAFGYSFGLSHTEIRCTPAGPRIVESHTRAGGDHIPELIQHALGIDVFDAFFAALSGCLTRPEPRIRRGAAVRFFTPTPGTVRSITGVETASSIGGVLETQVTVKVGDVAPIPRGNRYRCGHVLAVGESAREAAARANAARSAVRITTSGDPEEPARSEG